MLGGVPQLENRSMQVLVGGSREQFTQWKDFFIVFSHHCLHVGTVGQAAAMKLALNQMGLAQTASLAMSLGYLQEMNTDIGIFMDILRNSVHYSKGLEKKQEIMMKRDYANIRFPLRLMLKDGLLMRDNFKAEGIDASTLDGITSVFQKAVDMGYADADYIKVYDAFLPHG